MTFVRHFTGLPVHWRFTVKPISDANFAHKLQVASLKTGIVKILHHVHITCSGNGCRVSGASFRQRCAALCSRSSLEKCQAWLMNVVQSSRSRPSCHLSSSDKKNDDDDVIRCYP